jgi:KDO2-lipid IV(A) lauroyltransferase
MPKPQLVERVRLENPGDLQSVFDEGKRVLILAAHHCNWEWLLLRCSTAFDVPMTAAYKPATMPSGDRALKHMRSRFGATMVPAKQLVQHLLEQRGSVRLLALLADQSPAVSNEQQTWLQFFGRDTAFYKGAGWIATKLGYTVWFAAMRREQSGRYAVRFVRLDRPGERMDADAVLQAYASTLEAHVHAYPVEYFWAYKRWKRQKRLYDT